MEVKVMNLEKYYLFFEEYTTNYITNAESKTKVIHLTRKKEHSYRVVENALRIGKSLKLNDYNMYLLNIISLFHDLGRFPQFEKYQTYDDLISKNHAVLSIDVINKTNILSDFNDYDMKIIKKCILLHNEKEIPTDLNEQEFLLATILRDADKLDFFKGMVDVIPNLPIDEQKVFYSNKDELNVISDNVYNKIINREKIGNIEIKTKLDKQVRSFGFITSDLNYKESFNIIFENNYLEKIYNLLPKNEQVMSIYNMTKSFLLKKIDYKN
jgi:HD superfamily phosphodiesterase